MIRKNYFFNKYTEKTAILCENNYYFMRKSINCEKILVRNK